jgi:hypothetical protein
MKSLSLCLIALLATGCVTKWSHTSKDETAFYRAGARPRTGSKRRHNRRSRALRRLRRHCRRDDSRPTAASARAQERPQQPDTCSVR